MQTVISEGNLDIDEGFCACFSLVEGIGPRNLDQIITNHD